MMQNASKREMKCFLFICRFHKECIQKLATSSGYFFKCPMCNNKEEFDKEMKKFGIYVPEQDAAWEREGNIFDGIYQRKFQILIRIIERYLYLYLNM